MSTVIHKDTREDAQEADALRTASQWQLMRRKFSKHRLAVWSGWVVLALYAVATFCEIVAPYSLDAEHLEYMYAPPQRLRWIGEDGIHLWPFVYGLEGRRHPETLRFVYAEDHSRT